MELSCSHIKKIIVFSQRKDFLYFVKRNLLLYFRKQNPALFKPKLKKSSPKKILILQEIELSYLKELNGTFLIFLTFVALKNVIKLP